MKNKHIIILSLMLSVFIGLNAQNVSINADGSAPDASAMLDVKSTNKGFLAPRVSSTENVSSPATGLLVYQTGGTPGYYYYNGSSWVQLGAASGASQWTTSGSDIYYNTGNVGIGTATPVNRFEVSGSTFNRIAASVTADVQSGFQIIRTAGANDVNWEMYMPAGSTNLRFAKKLPADPSSIDILTLQNSGNVGIGTTSPSAKLHLTAGAGNAAIKIDNTSYLEFGAGISGKEGNAGKIAYQLFTADALDIIGAGTDGSNNRKIKFWAEGGSYFNGSIEVNGNISVSGSDVYFPNLYTFTTQNYSDLRINASNGRVAIEMSSRRYKENIRDMENIDWIYNLRPVNFNLKTDPEKGKAYGLIAEEVVEVAPEFVFYKNDVVEGVTYSKFISPLIKVVQEQQKAIVAQQQQIDELTKKAEVFDQLKAEVEDLKRLINSPNTQLTDIK